MATVNNIVIDQGTTFSFTVNLTNDDGTKKDLTITISLTAAQSSAVKAGRYVYDIEIASSTETLRIMEGIVTVTPEVTK
jgi:hypothetical protein